MRNSLWVFPSRRGELREGNSENLKHGNGNLISRVTRGGERKIGIKICNQTEKHTLFHNVLRDNSKKKTKGPT